MFPSKRPDPSGGTSVAKRRSSRISKTTPSPVMKVYKPSIYTYTCYGQYFASSKTGSGSEGVCKGIKSKLDVIENDETMPRVEALRRFSTVSTDFDVDDYDGELHQQAESTLMSPVLIFRNRKNIPDQELLPEEKTNASETWSCYGSTEVEYLVLQDLKDGSKTITAVAPKNTGVSIRDIQSPDWMRRITRIGLGWLDIIHDSSTKLEPASVKASGLHEEVAPKPLDTVKVTKEYFASLAKFSVKVAEHMEMNLGWLGNNLMDDFPSRTYSAGCRIMTQLPTTCEKTVTNLGRIVTRMLGAQDDDA